MPFSLETFACAVSALFQFLAVCAYLLSFPDVDGVGDQLPDVPEVIQDIAIDVKIKYSGIIFVFGFYMQVVVVTQRWNWWRKKMEEPDNSLMVMVGVYVHNLICNFFQVSHASMVLSSNLGTWLRKASCTTCGPPFFLASVFLVGICIVAGLSFFSDTWTSFLVLREKVRARMKEQEDATTETATNSETVTPADASPADAPPVAESKASEPTVGADSSGGVKEAKGLQAELLADLEADLEELRREREADRAKIEKLQAALGPRRWPRRRRSRTRLRRRRTILARGAIILPSSAISTCLERSGWWIWQMFWRRVLSKPSATSRGWM